MSQGRESSRVPPTVVPEVAQAMAAACSAFLETLDATQRGQAVFPFADEERYDWHYTPRPRRGLSLKLMDAWQLQVAEALVASGLSPRGLHQARQIIALEPILGEAERAAGTVRFDRDPELYFVSVFGAPQDTGPWGWRMEGHHLSLNFAAQGGAVAPTPLFFGANPAEVRHGPQRGLRVLADTEDLGRGLLRSLDAEQRRAAVIAAEAPHDLVTTNERRVRLQRLEGLPAARMTGEQRALLLALVGEYLGRAAEPVARAAWRRVEAAGVEALHFAWAGGEERGQGHYYRVHGPTLLLEYDNTQNEANHVHSVWREVTGDFGENLLQRHYQQAHGA